MMEHGGALWVAAFSFACAGLCMILIAVLSLTIVRRLRRVPEVRGRLGFSVFPGGDALNVATALSWPRPVMQLLDTSPMSWFFAHADSMYQYTSKAERWLARACYATQVLSVVTLFAAAALQRWS